MDIIEKLKKEKTKWENRIYGVGETRIDLMIEDVIRELQKYKSELEKKEAIINEMVKQLAKLREKRRGRLFYKSTYKCMRNKI